jgi:hypothetical protein
MVVYVPGPGRHTITVAVTDTAGRTASASATRTFRLPEVDYAAVALPDLGHGGGATFVHAGGAVAGWVATAQGRRRPAVWRAGALELVPAPDSVDVVATHLNGAGDVLLRFGGPGYVAPGANVRVRRADGALLAVGPLKYLAPEMARGLNQCCDLAADLTEDRVALASSQQSGPYGTRSALLDVATGRPDSVAERLVARNERGQMLGDRWTGSLYPSTYLETVGFALPPAPAGPAAYRCDPFAGRFTTELPVDLDNAGNVLSRYCGNFALRSTLGSEWLDRYVGRAAAARLSRTGGVVVARDTAGALTRWTLAARIPERLRVAGAWRLESLGGVNAGGAIVGQGVNASGRRAALLLTPAPR